MIKEKKGSAIIIAIVGTAVLFGIGSYLLRNTLVGDTISKSFADSKKAYYLAESGINEAVWRLKNDPEWEENFIDENLNPDLSGNFWSDGFSREDIGGGSYSVTIQSLGLGYGEITSVAEVPFLDKKARRKIKTLVYRGTGSPTYDAGIFTGGPSQNVALTNVHLIVNKGNIFSNNLLDISNSTIEVYDDPDKEEKQGNIIAIKDVKLKGNNEIIQDGGICTEDSCSECCNEAECDACEELPAIMVDFDSENPYSFKERAKKKEQEGDCKIYCKEENGTKNLCFEKCALSRNEFDNLLDEVGSGGTLYLENEITYVEGQVIIKEGTSVKVGGVLLADQKVDIEKNSHIRIEPLSDDTASGLLAKGKIDFRNSLLEDTLIEGVIFSEQEISMTGISHNIEIIGSMIARKFSLTSLSRLEITLNDEKIRRALGYEIDGEQVVPIFSPIVQLDHWEEVY